MTTFERRQIPDADVYTWDGIAAGEEILDLARRAHGDLVAGSIIEGTEPYLGVNVLDENGMALIRVDTGNTLVYDPTTTPVLFTLPPETFAALYEVV